MKQLKYLFLLLFLFPLTVFAEDSISISNFTLINKEGNTVELSPVSVNGTTISLDTKMYEVGDSIEYQFTIENNTNNEYGIDTSNLNSEYVHYQLKSDNGNIIKPSSTNTYTLTATYENEVPQDSFKGGKFEVGVDQLLELKDPSLINPLTGNYFYMFLLLIITISIIFGLKLKYKKTVITILLFGMFVIPYYTHAIEAIHLNFGLKIGNVLPTHCVYDGDLVQGAEYVNGQYTYRYMQQNGWDYQQGYVWVNMEEDGWGVSLTDKNSTDPVTSTLCTTINDKPLVSTQYAFKQSKTIEIDTSSWDLYNVKSMYYMFWYCESITDIDLSNVDTSNVIDFGCLFQDCSSLVHVNVDGLVTSNAKEINHMFFRCGVLQNVDLSSFDTSNVVDISYMFYGCSAITNIDMSNFDTSKVTRFNYLFYDCNSLDTLNINGFDFSCVTSSSSMERFNTWNAKTVYAKNLKLAAFDNYFYLHLSNSSMNYIDVSGWDFGNAKTLRSLFSGNSSLTTIIGLDTWNTSNITNMYGMFESCSSLKSLDLSTFDTSSVTDMSYMFSGCNFNHLDLSTFDTSSVTDMSSMFEGCSNLTSMDLSVFNTSNVTDMSSMFEGCSNLTSMDLSVFNTSNVTDMSGMFKDCSSLQTIDVSGFDTSKVTSIGSMFYGCSSLTEIDVTTFDTTNCGGFAYLFYGCTGLTSLDLSNFDFSKVVIYYSVMDMFKDCTNLSIVYGSSTNVSTLRGPAANPSSIPVEIKI